MTLAITELVHTLVTAPGATSSATASAAYTADYTYVVAITQFRTDSVHPDTPVPSGLGVTSWVDVSGANESWDTDGASQRRTSVFVGTATSSGNGPLTVSYASAPADIDIHVIQCAGATSGASAVVQVVDATGTVAAGALTEVTLASFEASANRAVVFAVMNINAATSRLELAADTGGDANWTTFTVRNSSNSPTGTYIGGTLDGNSDLTPGLLNASGTTTASYYLVAIEIEEAIVVSSSAPYVGIRARVAGDEPPPPSYRLLVGAACAIRAPANTYAASTEDFEVLCGINPGQMPIGRRYYSSFPNSFTGISQFDQDVGVRHRVISVKTTTTTQGQWENFLATIPNDGFTTRFTANHEPEDNMTTTEFKQRLAVMHAAWVALGRPAHLIPYFCVIGFFDRDGNTGNDTPQWYPDASIRDDFEFWPDVYDPNGQVTLEQMAGPCLDKWTANGGTSERFGVAETGSHRPDAQAANWMEVGCDWMRSLNMAGITWFNSPVGDNAPWWIDDDRDFPNRVLAPAQWGVEMLT